MAGLRKFTSLGRTLQGVALGTSALDGGAVWTVTPALAHCVERAAHMSCMNHRVSSSHSPLLVLDSHSRCLDEAVENNEANNSQND